MHVVGLLSEFHHHDRSSSQGRELLSRYVATSDQSPYRAAIFSLRREHAVQELASKTNAVLFVDDPNDADNPAPADLYSRTFRLTPAEARLAVHLASGASLMETADEFGVTHNTVRAQLRAIFDKTETHRQIDLVRLLQRSSNLRITLS